MSIKLPTNEPYMVGKDDNNNEKSILLSCQDGSIFEHLTSPSSKVVKLVDELTSSSIQEELSDIESSPGENDGEGAENYSFRINNLYEKIDSDPVLNRVKSIKFDDRIHHLDDASTSCASDITLQRSNLCPILETDLSFAHNYSSCYISLGSAHFQTSSSDQVCLAMKRGEMGGDALVKNSGPKGKLARSDGKKDVYVNREQEMRILKEKEISTLSFDLSDSQVMIHYDDFNVTKKKAADHVKNGKINEAVLVMDDFIEKNKNSVLRNDTLICSSLHYVGMVYLKFTEEYQKSLIYFDEVLHLRKNSLSVASTFDFSQLLFILGVNQYAVGNYAQAQANFEKALSLCIESLGVAHFRVAEISNNLGVVYCRSGESKRAFDMLQKSFKIQKSLLRHGLYNFETGSNQDRKPMLVNIATTGANLGLMCIKLERNDNAITFLEAALMNQTLFLDHHDSLVLATMENLATANFFDPNRSLKMLVQLLRIVIDLYGQHHLVTAQMWSKMSRVHFHHGSHARAQECSNHVFECYRQNVVKDSKYVFAFEKLVKSEKILQKRIDTSITSSVDGKPSTVSGRTASF